MSFCYVCSKTCRISYCLRSIHLKMIFLKKFANDVFWCDFSANLDPHSDARDFVSVLLNF